MKPRHLSEDQLAWLAMDAMEPEELLLAKAHLAGCATCRAALAEEQAFEAHLHETYAGAGAAPPKRPRVHLAILAVGMSLAAAALLTLDSQPTRRPPDIDPSLGLHVGRTTPDPGADVLLPSELCLNCGR